jgi:hypothetical protein
MGLKSRLGTVMGRRKNTASVPPPVPSVEKAKKDKNRSSLMPFRRGDSSRSQQDSPGTLNTGRDLATPSSTEEAKPSESSKRSFDSDKLLPMPAKAAQRQDIPQSSVVVNGTTNHVNVTSTNNPYDQTSSSNNVPPPSTQVRFCSGMPWNLPNHINSQLTNSV